MKIAVARDEAFNFTYRENIDRLREIGEVIFFSPIHDKKLPLYSPLSSRLSFPNSVRLPVAFPLYSIYLAAIPNFS